MNSKDLSKVQADRRMKGLRASRGLCSNIFHSIFGERSEKFALAAEKTLLPQKKFSLALSRDQLRLVGAAVLPCGNDNFINIGTDEDRKNLKKMITLEMIKSTR